MSDAVSIEVNDIIIPDPHPDKPKFDWINHRAESEIKMAEEALDSVRKMVSGLRRKVEKAEHDVEALRAENWKDEQLLAMRRSMQEAVDDMNRGFPITKSELDSIYTWMKQHDTFVHNNPHQYHGASGGGFEFVFYPTGIGTAGDCICSSCKSSCISQFGAKWYQKCVDMGGVFEFQKLG